jgi:hypothetical protein
MVARDKPKLLGKCAEEREKQRRKEKLSKKM